MTMKTHAVLYIALVTASAVLAVDDALAQKAKAAFAKCREENKITDAEADQIHNRGGVPSSHEAKCLAACMLKEGKMLKDGVYSKDNALVMADVFHKDDADQAAKSREVIENCVKEVGTDASADECEFAYKMAVCGDEQAKKLGVKIPEFQTA